MAPHLGTAAPGILVFLQPASVWLHGSQARLALPPCFCPALAWPLKSITVVPHMTLSDSLQSLHACILATVVKSLLQRLHEQPLDYHQRLTVESDC